MKVGSSYPLAQPLGCSERVSRNLIKEIVMKDSSTGKVRVLQQGAQNGGIIGEHGMVDSGRSVSDAPILAGSSGYKEMQP